LAPANGIPLSFVLTPANVHDSMMLAPVLDAVPPIRQCAGRPRKRPAKLHTDKAYDFPRCRRACRQRRIMPRIARRGIESRERLGRYRWVVERFHRTVLDEFFRTSLRGMMFDQLDDLQAKLDAWLHYYNHERPHRGYRNMGRRPIEAIIQASSAARHDGY
jgi:hypothetical protein